MFTRLYDAAYKLSLEALVRSRMKPSGHTLLDLSRVSCISGYMRQSSTPTLRTKMHLLNVDIYSVARRADCRDEPSVAQLHRPRSF